MIAVATDAYRNPIREKEKIYTQLYEDVVDLIELLEYEEVFIENSNQFKSLYDWKACWSSLSGYASKASFVHDLYKNFFNQTDFVLCQYYVKNKSQQDLLDDWQVSKFEDFIAKIEKLKGIMISVANQGQPIDLIRSEEENYITLYRKITLEINLMQEIGIKISHPNSFRSLCQWYNYWSSELEKSYAVREKYINNLYEAILKPINRALKQYPSKLTNTKEFIEHLQSKLNSENSTLPSTKSPIITSTLSNSVETANYKVDNNIQQIITEPVYNSSLLPLPPGYDNSIFTYTNFSVSWSDNHIMNPEVFLEQEDIVSLVDSLEKLFTVKIDNSNNRRSIFSTSGVDNSFIRSMIFNQAPVEFTNIIVAKFKDYKYTTQRFNYHPMINLLQYLLQRKESYELEDQDIDLFKKLTERGQENFKALEARSSVCRIESPKGTGIGTGVLVGGDLLLTCNHIFSKTQAKQAWVRLNYSTGNYLSDKDLFEVDMNFVSNHNRPDYALIKIKGYSQQKTTILSDEILDSGQEIRIIHHPQGKPALVSDLGLIMQVGEDYIDHNLKTDNASSGAPIFNRGWEVVAIHQGNVGIGRNCEPGTTGGIPIRIIWNQISSYLT
ncbi:trypsin-like peptidase domain-containing protein [Dulcicalothrix desertica]|nr:trypsin-like peptidase domain-containing protein [Dulcicalothrix desertica]